MARFALIIILISAVVAAPPAAFCYNLIKEVDEPRVDSYRTDLDRNGIRETVTLIRREQSDFPEIIFADSSLQVECLGRIFSRQINTVTMASGRIDELIVSNDINPFIAVYYPSATRGWSVELYSFTGKDILKTITISSDLPVVEVKDVDNDGVMEIVVMKLERRKGSRKTRFVNVYKFIDDKWRLVSSY